MINQWLVAALGGLTLFGGASTTADHRPPLRDLLRPNASNTRELHDGRELKELRRMATSTGGTVDLSCVAAAVAAREATLGAAATTLGTDLSAAYSARATALAAAYGSASTTEIRVGVKTAWQQFGAAAKLARKNWQKAREGAWMTFKTAIKACGPGSQSAADTMNMGQEVQGI